MLEKLFFRDSTAHFNEKPKKLGTVQHFCNPEEQKCCTVPKFFGPGTKNLGTVQHFCSPEEQKCCTVPKFFGPGTTNLGTVQHFCNPEEQKCCTVPKFFWSRNQKFRDSTALLQSRGAKVLYCP